jgi:hypothetical protein
MGNSFNAPEPSRIATLRSEIVAAIPCIAKHEDEARQELEALRLDDLLHAYLKWAYRFVPREPREVTFASNFWEADVAKSHGGEILAMARRIEEGQDLSRYLSPLLLRRGYVPRRVREQAPHHEKRWRDKDFILNALGLHHLHISNGAKEHGRFHGDELAFVEFTRLNSTIRNMRGLYSRGRAVLARPHTSSNGFLDTRGLIYSRSPRVPYL